MSPTLGSALGALLLISSLTTTHALTIERRALSLPSTQQGTWQSKGCWVDVGRTLTSGGYNSAAMTDESCIDYCSTHGYIYAGTEYSQECYCGMAIASGATQAPMADCSSPCGGNSTEPCGGGNRLNLFWSGTTGPQTNPGVGLWKFSGCYAEGKTGRTLPDGVATTGGSGAMTVALCTSACQTAGYNLAGIEYSGECYCGNSISNGGALAPGGLSDCSMLCNGNYSEYCGGPSRLNLYDYNNTVALPPYTTVTSNTPLTSTGSSSSTSTLPANTSTSSSSSVSSSTSTQLTITSTSSSYSPPSTSASLSQTSASSSSAAAMTTLGIRPTVGSYSFLGCFTEATNARALPGAAFYDYKAMTLESCATDCAGFSYFGVEYGGECYCGNALGTGSVLAAIGDCSFTCPGNALEYCGAGNRLEMYKFGVTATSVSSTTSTGTYLSSTSVSSTSVSSASVSSTSSSISVSSSSTTSALAAGTGFPTGWTNQGCWVDGVTGRILSIQQPDNAKLTRESCANLCSAAGYTIAGVEYSSQCFCDNAIYNGGVLATNQADCNMPCSGSSSEICGAGGRMNLFSLGTPTAYAPPGPLTTGLPTGWVYKGCLQDNIPSNEDPNEQLYTFPYKVWDTQTNNPVDCLNQCQKFGFNAAGLEYGSQCFCGDAQNIQVASAPGTSTDPTKPQFYTRSRVPQIVANSQCNAACTGDKTHMCGANNLLNYYAFQGTPALYNWAMPTGTAAGQYDLLIGGVVVPLMTSQMVTGKVTFIEKYGSGEPNGTGAYELDLSQTGNFNAAWRAMTGLQTDVFCSAGLILPDKGGRQLTIGGWAGESNYGVRLYLPNGSNGVSGTNEWAEDKVHLMLQVPRWYPSALIMANGSILIVGGEIGSNAAEQPTLELLPQQGVPDTTTTSGYSNTTVYLDFLDRTSPFNLYPFITVIPSGIFIAYYNEARILDEKTFQTIKTLPNMPGAVNDPTGGRSYQLEGAMVTLPQVYPYTDNMVVLICGGSTSGGGYPIDNCVSTAPEDAAPTWTIERMPSRRVMPCMAGLPDGTYIILNGAQHGVAGFGLGGDPNYNAVLYDPTKPYNSRMSIMANTTIARLYHSEAIVLLDGRVLVTGSDPTGDYTQPAGEFPEEYRVEVFSPPYLFAGTRPSFSITNTDWAYTGATSTATFTVSGSTAGLKVSLLGAVVSTHGNSMGQRTLFPLVTCTGQSCTVTAPPNAHICPPGWYMMFVVNSAGIPSVGQYVRIGGDPAGLGNWPKLPGFQLPGV